MPLPVGESAEQRADQGDWPVVACSRTGGSDVHLGPCCVSQDRESGVELNGQPVRDSIPRTMVSHFNRLRT